MRRPAAFVLALVLSPALLAAPAAGKGGGGIAVLAPSRGGVLAAWTQLRQATNTRGEVFVTAAPRAALLGAPSARWRALPLRGPWPDAAQVATDRVGATYAVWLAYTGSAPFVVAAVRRARARAWSRPVRLSARGRTAVEPRIAVAPDGTAVVAWTSLLVEEEILRRGTRSRIGGARVQASVRRPGSPGWSRAADLAPAGSNAGAPEVAIDATGRVVVVWERQGEGGWRVEASTRGAGAESFGTAHMLSAPSAGRQEPRLAVNRAGSAVVAWARSGEIEATVRRTREEDWPSARPVAASIDPAESPTVGIDAAGAATVVWREGHGRRIRASTGYGIGAWSASRTISPPGGVLGPPALAVGRGGAAVTAWVRSRPGGDTSRGAVHGAARAPHDFAWRSVGRLSAPGVLLTGPRAAISADGLAVVAWERGLGARFRAEAAAARPADGPWGRPARLP